jgi:hypothetical protein
MGTAILGKLTHLAFVRVGTAVTLYINGKNMGGGIGSLNATFASGTGNVAIGNRIGASEYWNGLVAGVRVFNTALTAAQVADLYLNPEKITPDGVATSALKLWLPMMEGAGASAYDGSGNGNDGTINGATWTAGVGAPVAQTALVSWNKGQNLITYSEDFSNAYWQKQSVTLSANSQVSPNGTQTADTITITTANGEHNVYNFTAVTITANVNFTASVFVKNISGRYFGIATYFAGIGFGPYATFDLTTGTLAQSGAAYGTYASSSIEDYGNGWYLISVTGQGNYTSLIIAADARSAGALVAGQAFIGSNEQYAIWGASLRPTSAGDAYIKTNATAQTSAVLVPEGLTAGASIFGTDIITPRNAFALNLDGASWAQVGDNASLDFGTGALTIECWAKAKFVNQGSSANAIFSLGAEVNGSDTGALTSSASTFDFWLGGTAISTGTFVANTWNHIVGVRSGSTISIYLNGTLQTTGTNSNSITNASAKNIGRDNNTVRYYNDQLANPRIYNRALTAAEVLRNYNADKAKFGL